MTTTCLGAPMPLNHKNPRSQPKYSTETPCLGKGAPIFERPGEAILHNSPSVSGRVDSSIGILPHIEEPLKSHITSDHSRDDTPYHSFILHQQPSPLDIVVDQLVSFLGGH